MEAYKYIGRLMIDEVYVVMTCLGVCFIMT